VGPDSGGPSGAAVAAFHRYVLPFLSLVAARSLPAAQLTKLMLPAAAGLSLPISW